MTKTTAALKLAEEALNAMLTHMGMDEDEWTKPTFNQAREALAAIRAARAQEQAGQEPVAEALQIASVALQDIACSSQTENLYWWQLRARKAQKQIAECLTNAAPVEPAKQEPVAWVDEIGKRLDGTYIFNAVGKVDVGQPLYAAPVSVEAAVLAEREACAKVCEEVNTANKGFPLNAKTYAAAIRARGEK